MGAPVSPGGGMVDTQVLGTCALRRESSSLSQGTKVLKFQPDGVWKDSARKCRFVRTITWLVAVVAAYEHGDMKIRISNVTV